MHEPFQNSNINIFWKDAFPINAYGLETLSDSLFTEIQVKARIGRVKENKYGK